MNTNTLEHWLAIADLTHSRDHAISHMVEHLSHVLAKWSPHTPLQRVTGGRVVSANDNYRLLGYPSDSITMEARYTRWVDADQVLRTQTTSLITGELVQRAATPEPLLLLAPGLVYRRDVRDRWHCATPHQMDVWVVWPVDMPQAPTLMGLVETICTTAMPGTPWRHTATQHPYTEHGIEVEAQWEQQWLEVMEAGHIHPQMLQRCGWDPSLWTGLALGMGLDRLVMVCKALPDIRLLRDPLPKVANQMTNLDPWKDVSRQPAACRELSLAREPDEPEEVLVAAVVESMGQHAHLLEEVRIVGRWAATSLPQSARERQGMKDHQENVALRLVMRPNTGAIARELATDLAAQVYRSVHQGSSLALMPSNG